MQKMHGSSMKDLMGSVDSMMNAVDAPDEVEADSLARVDQRHVQDNAVQAVKSTTQWQTEGSEQVAPFIIDHTSFVYRLYSNVVLFAVVVTVITLPLRLAFLHDDEAALQLDTYLTILFAFDILVEFRTTYIDPTSGAVQSDGRRIALRYAFSYLIPDLLATIPFDQLAGGEAEALASLALLRFLRIRRIITWFGTIERSETVSYHTVAIIKFVFLLLCNGHTAACCFFFLSRLEDHAGGKTWVGEQCPEIIEDSLWKQYETSFYWAVTTLSTVGYGDVSPVSGSERIAVAFWMLLNLGITAYIVGMLASMSTRGDEDTREFREKLSMLASYGLRNNVPAELAQTMRAYLSLKHNFNGSSGGAADGSFEEMFPSFIASKVRNIRHRPLLNKIPLFNGGGGDGDGQDARVTDVAFMTALTARATEEVLMDGMRIFEQDDIAQECYVLTSGKAVVLVPDNDDQEQEVLICNAGSVLGAESFFSGLMMPYAIKILGTSRTLKLTNSERDDLFDGFPEQGRWIMGQLTDLNAQKKKCAEDAIESVTESIEKLNAVRNKRRGSSFKGIHGGGIHLDRGNFTRAMSSLEEGPRSLSFKMSSSPKDSKPRALGLASPTAQVLPTQGTASKEPSSPISPGAGSPTADLTSDDKSDNGSETRSTTSSSIARSTTLAGIGGTIAKESKLLEALIRLDSTCDTFDLDLMAQRSVKEKELAEIICDFASKNMASKLQQLAKVLEIKNIPGDYDNRTAVHLASAHGHVDILQLLVQEECPISEVDRFGRTPLYEACINRHEACVKLLRSANAKLMLPDPGGEMCRVAFAGDVVLMKIFILAGAKAHAGDYDARTALHIAACEGNTPMCTLLSTGSHGRACLDAKDRWGKTAAEEAEREGHTKLSEQLKQAAEDAPSANPNSMDSEEEESLDDAGADMPFRSMEDALRDNAPRPRIKPNSFILTRTLSV
eukprot:CAMPEP_0119466174 /NCGR_PEP_ID=MMETSP1344-20130328/951_1 /TAXON_ID=236787 /ORGANISM="Florenciella parvula, Strain CCMP2471" /LENGTH=954 /DNA_ID=CAMNT_0007498471 /DNA_START=242 /DNA_END=3106 /DNA_ORIENTATION=-